MTIRTPASTLEERISPIIDFIFDELKVTDMTEIDYHKVGEEFDHDGIKFHVIDTCDLCDMKNDCYNPILMSCTCDQREDKKYVIYREFNKRKEIAKAIVLFLALLLFALFMASIFVLVLDSEYILSAVLAVACLFVISDVYVSRKYR